MTTDLGTPEAGDPAEQLPPLWRRRLASLRVRIVVWNLMLLLLALLLLLITVRVILLARLDERIDAELRQEVEELRTLAGGIDPSTAEPFADDVGRLFEVFLTRNIPARNEQMLAFVDGVPFRRSIGTPPARLDLEAELMSHWAGVTAPERDRHEHDVAGRVEYLAVPLNLGGETAGVFVVAFFRDLEAADIDELLRVSAAVGGLVLLIAGSVAWNVAGRVLDPIRGLTETARSITDSDLSRRIPVEGSDELSLLAATFNRMLDRLETAFATQRAFVDDAGHELRTPITIIRGHLEILDHSDADERVETLALVVDELDRMHRMVEDLLLLAKSGQPDFLKLATVDLDQLTREVHAKAQGLAERVWQIGGTARALAVADRQRLTQALIQLAQNAVQHTVPGDTIWIGSAVHEGWARLWVRDAGTGIGPADRERIFGRFARGTGARAEGNGAGLGLAIVRAIAVAHDGWVELDSSPGAGALFTIVVPLDQEGRG